MSIPTLPPITRMWSGTPATAQHGFISIATIRASGCSTPINAALGTAWRWCGIADCRDFVRGCSAPKIRRYGPSCRRTSEGRLSQRGKRLLRGGNRALHVVFRMGCTEEGCLVLRRRQIDAMVEHAAEEFSEFLCVRLRRRIPVCHRTRIEKPGKHGAYAVVGKRNPRILRGCRDAFN